MEFRVLGPLEVVAAGPPLALGGPKQRALLVELLRDRGAVSVARLVAAVWGDDPPRSAVGSVQVYVHGLRRVLGDDRIETAGPAYRLRVDPGEVDLERFERLVERARLALARDRPADAADDLGAALALWRGAALADLREQPGASAFARELEERRLEALELRNDAWLALGRHDLVLQEIDRLVEEEPYNERLRAQQIVALYRDGRQTDALAAYRTLRDTWHEALGIEPTPALRELERAVLRHDPSLRAPAPPRAPTRRLPAPPTPLVGRRLEIAAVSALLRSETRLVTLVGPGGTGKTRLALAVAEELARELRDGAVFVDLSAVGDPELLVPTVARSLDVAADAVAAELADRSLLLVLDNVEQIAEGAPAVATLLSGAPRLRVLATSRTPLRLAAEHEYRVPPLPLPRVDAGVDELAQNEAVQLFVARARAVGQAIAADEQVAALCRRLDGLPLALELAAARTKLLSPAEILERLDRDAALLASAARDVPARHSTLAATIRWSLDLLDEDELHAFARLGVFVGGCTVEAAERVGVELGALEALVDHSLLQRRERRFTMLETVRPFAVELLDAHGGDDVRRLHAEWLTELAETIEAELTQRADVAARLDELEAELDNIRAALDWTTRADAIDLGLRLISATRPFWEIRGRLREGGRLADDVLRAAGDRWPALRAKALGFAGTVAFRSGRLEDADAVYRELLSLYEQLGDAEGIARGLSDVGTVAAAIGDFERSAELLEQAADRFRALGESKRLAVALANLGHVAAQRGDFAGAAAVTLEALAVQRDLGDEQRQAISLNNLGSFAFDAGRPAEARRWLDECLDVSLRLGYKEVVAHALVTLVRIALHEDEREEAARLAAAADALLDEAGVQLLGAEGERFLELKEELGGQYAAARAAVDGATAEELVRLAR